MDDMPRPRPLHLQRQLDRQGRAVWYVRKGHGPRTRLRERFGTEEFWQEYRDAVAGKTTAPKKVAAGTLRWAIDLYRNSGEWGDYKQATRKQRENIFRAVIETGGERDLSDINQSTIEAGRDRRKATPHSANNFVKAMRGLFAWLVAKKHIKTDPTIGVALLTGENDDEGFKVWPEALLERFEAYYPVGTRARLAFDCILYTGLRRGDVVRLGKQHTRDGTISIRTEKARKGRQGALVTLPLLPPLLASIEATPIGDLTYLINERGTPWVKESFGNWFRERCDEAGCYGYSAHGLRKSGATRAADNGATVHQLMAIFGWTTPKMAMLYTVAADRKRLAREGSVSLLKAQDRNAASLTEDMREGADENQRTKSIT